MRKSPRLAGWLDFSARGERLSAPVYRKTILAVAAGVLFTLLLHNFGIIHLDRVFHSLRYGLTGRAVPYRELRLREGRDHRQ